MSISCDETDKIIDCNQPLFAGARDDVKWFSALSLDVIAAIPPEARCSSGKCASDKGVDIHEATSSVNEILASYNLSDFKLGRFLFSLNEHSAMKYLPNHYRRYKRTKEKSG